MKDEKLRVSYRFTRRTVALLERLAACHDTTITHILEEAVREKARRERVYLSSREDEAIEA